MSSHKKQSSFIGRGSHHAVSPVKSTAKKATFDDEIERVRSPLRHTEGMDEL